MMKISSLLLSLCLFAACAPAEGERTASGAPADSATAAAGRPRIVFIGTSLTAGYGLTPDKAYPALIQQKIDSAGYSFQVVNAGVSGETSAGGLRRIDWLLREPLDVLVIELGANDALRGLSTEALNASLRGIILRTRERYPQARILLLRMEAPPNLGREYVSRFRDVYAEAAAGTGAVLGPFLLEGVGGQRKFNQADGIHPTAEGQRMVAETVWAALEPLL